ncbi:MAG: hypothetical protein K8W52_08345 [Deltaproteobacteria bacterium]|nr:hypothetical protein [Deltaproteobacteria bacterium]
MTPFERVLAEPGSIAARAALAAAGDPRKPLIETQLAALAARRAGHVDTRVALDAQAQGLITAGGAAWAGTIARLVPEYEFHRGLVARVILPADEWRAKAAQLVKLAPIQHVKLKRVGGSIAETVAMPEMRQLTSLMIPDQDIGDAGAIAIATSPNVANLRYLDLGGNDIGEAGVEALAASPYLAHCVFVHFTGNPADPTPIAAPLDNYFGRPPLAAKLEQMFGHRPWLDVPSAELPPDFDDVGAR